MQKKTLRELLHEVDPKLKIISRSQYRHGNGAFPLPPSIQEIYGFLEELEERLLRIEAILKRLPENTIDELAEGDEAEELDVAGVEMLTMIRQIEERRGIKLHPKLKVNNVVLTIIQNQRLCFKPYVVDKLSCPCDDPIGNGCHMFISQG
ncbi:MAG: hypothetical protein WC455_13120 [Dehalococcoidia bacterium]|jgi:hypothetical protein